MAIQFLSSPEPQPELPRELVAAPLTGWRIWRVRQRPAGFLSGADLEEMADAFDRGENPFRRLGGYRLAAVGQGTDWTRQMHAKCSRGGHKDRAPQSGCSCGIWSLKTQVDAEKTLAEYWRGDEDCFYALGTVQIWGRIIECERGYRSEYAKPLNVSVFAPQDVADEIATQYGCAATSEETPSGIFQTNAQTMTFRDAMKYVDPSNYPTLCRAILNEKPAVSPKIEWLLTAIDGVHRVEWNYTQILRVPFDPVKKDVREGLEEMLADVEKTLVNGHRNAQPEGGLVTRLCGGTRFFLGRDAQPDDYVSLRTLRAPTLLSRGWHGAEWLCEFSVMVRAAEPVEEAA